MNSLQRVTTLLALLGSFFILTGAVRIIQDIDLNSTGGTKITLTDLTAGGTWTGWVQASSMAKVHFDIDFVDGVGVANTIDQVAMRCESSTSSATANDAGRDMQGLSMVLAGTEATVTSLDLVTRKALAAAGVNTAAWTWTVQNIPAPFVNCLLFAGAGAPEAGDTINVFARGSTP